MAFTWDDILLQKIRDIIIQHGFNVHPLDPTTATRQELTTWLTTRHIEPAQFIGQVHHHAAPVPAPPPPRKVKLQLPQADTEDLFDYVRRFECTILLHAVPADQQEADRQQSVLPPLVRSTPHRGNCPNHPVSTHTLDQCRLRTTTWTPRNPILTTRFNGPRYNAPRYGAPRSTTPRFGGAPPRFADGHTQCFRCNHYGHLARDCTTPPGN